MVFTSEKHYRERGDAAREKAKKNDHRKDEMKFLRV